MLIALGGGASAVAVAYAGTRGILSLVTRAGEFPSLSPAPSLPVLGFALLVSLATGVLFGMVPAWVGAKASPGEALRGANRSTRDASAMPQRVLVILQAALSLVLLSTAGLLVTSLRHLERQDFHFDPQGRLFVQFDPLAAGLQYNQLPGLYKRFDDAFARLPGVQGFAYATYGPMANNTWTGGVALPGVPDGGQDSFASYSSVSPGFFSALGTRLLRGRGIREQDTATGTHVGVVNQAFVRRFSKASSRSASTSAPTGKELASSRLWASRKIQNT